MPVYVDSLSRIIDFVEQLAAADTAGVEPMAHPLADQVQRLRAGRGHRDRTSASKFQHNAPQRRSRPVSRAQGHRVRRIRHGARRARRRSQPSFAAGSMSRRTNHAYLTVSELAAGLRARQFSSVELTQHLLERIERLDPALNAFITVTRDRALADARAADAALARGEGGPLTGVPIAHKDIFCTDGIRTTCGSKMLDNFVAPYDATVVARLARRRHGAARQDQHGRVRDGLVERDQLLRPGAESVGPSHACRAAPPVAPPRRSRRASRRPRAAPTPAARSASPPRSTDLTGLKPTYGRVSRYGMIAFASSLDQAGVLDALGRGRRAAARSDGGLRPARFDQCRSRRCRDYVGGARSAAQGPARRHRARILRRRARPAGRQRCVRAAIDAAAARRAPWSAK